MDVLKNKNNHPCNSGFISARLAYIHWGGVGRTTINEWEFDFEEQISYLKMDLEITSKFKLKFGNETSSGNMYTIKWDLNTS